MAQDMQPQREHVPWYEPASRPGVEHSSRSLWIRFLLILVFSVVVFALGDAMVANHFFTGGALNNHRGYRAGP